MRPDTLGAATPAKTSLHIPFLCGTPVKKLARCELEAERLYPAPHNKGAQNWPERAANLQKRAENIETCMRAADSTKVPELQKVAKS